jgi:hypothetical protein
VNDVHKLCCFGGVCVRINDKHQIEIEGQTDRHTHTQRKREEERGLRLDAQREILFSLTDQQTNRVTNTNRKRDKLKDI